MTSRLAFEPITLKQGDIALHLRPSLRAGYLIAQRYTLDELRDALDQIRFSDIVYLIGLGSDDVEGTADFISKLSVDKGLSGLYDHLPYIAAFVDASLGLGTAEDSASPGGTAQAHFKEPDFIRLFEGLFEFATGWLKWTPAETWAATPTEIHAARKGHFAMLRAIHGDGSEAKDKAPTNYTTADLKRVEELGHDPEYDRAGVAALFANMGASA